MEDLVDWTLRRTAGIPKSQRFTFALRLDNLTLDAMMVVTRAVFASPTNRRPLLQELNLLLEQLRVLWCLVEKRGWVSEGQLLHVNGRIDEIGRMPVDQLGCPAGARSIHQPILCPRTPLYAGKRRGAGRGQYPLDGDPPARHDLNDSRAT